MVCFFHGTTDIISFARQLHQKAREQQKLLHLVFLNLKKFYDCVPLEPAEKCHDVFAFFSVTSIQALHLGITVRIMNQNSMSCKSTFTWDEGCRARRCSYTKSNFVLSRCDSSEKLIDDPGVNVKYSFDCSVFNRSPFFLNNMSLHLGQLSIAWRL